MKKALKIIQALLIIVIFDKIAAIKERFNIAIMKRADFLFL
jgi:hypothetical protein